MSGACKADRKQQNQIKSGPPCLGQYGRSPPLSWIVCLQHWVVAKSSVAISPPARLRCNDATKDGPKNHLKAKASDKPKSSSFAKVKRYTDLQVSQAEQRESNVEGTPSPPSVSGVVEPCPEGIASARTTLVCTAWGEPFEVHPAIQVKKQRTLGLH